MTDDLTERQRQSIDVADDTPDEATEDDLDTLLELTRHPDSEVRVEAARATSTVAATQPDLVAPRLPDVIGLLHNHDLDVRTFGQDTVGYLGSKRPEALEGTTAVRHLAQGFTDENEFVRANAAETLGIVGETAPDLLADSGVLHSLVATVEGDEDYPEARAQAARALGRIGKAEPSLIDDRTVERLEAVAARDDEITGTVDTVIDSIETARTIDHGSDAEDADTEFCPACGAELDADPAPNFCRNCGQEL